MVNKKDMDYNIMILEDQKEKLLRALAISKERAENPDFINFTMADYLVREKIQMSKVKSINKLIGFFKKEIKARQDRALTKRLESEQGAGADDE